MTAPSVKANAGREEQACGYVHSEWGGGLTANLINFLCDTWCVEQSYLHKKSAVSGLSEWIKWKKNRDGTHQTHTWCECDVQRNETFWGKWRGRQGYPPGGGETSREISGKGGAPLLSGATLSEHVTNIAVDGTAAFHKHKASASAMPLSVPHSNIHTKANTQKHT